MSKSYKFRGEVDHSFPKKKKPLSDKPVVEKPEDQEDDTVDPHKYLDWEEEGNFEKFDRKRW